MAKIHMETENVRTLARLLDQKAGDLDEGVERLKRARSRLAGAWSGGSREKRFMSQYNSLLKQMDTKAHELQVLSMRLYREVDEWERADTKGQQSIKSIKEASAGLFYGLLSPFYLIRGNVKEYSITETWEFLNSTQTGKDLEALAKQHGICFILPDGTKIGDPEGEIINIYFDDTGDYAGYQQDNKIVIDDTLDWTDKGVDSVGAILAHEMQHAIDREAGLLQDYSGFESITDQEQLEEFLEQQTETRIASEVRAYERTENIILGTEYQDDGITSPSEIRRIIVDKDYETIYENQLNQLLYPNYTVDVYLNESTGELEVNLYPFINENFGNYA